jgi:hypothetical protein
MEGFPGYKEWLGMLLFVFAAIIVINTVARRVSAVQSISQGF